MRVAHVVPRGEQPWSGILTVIVHLVAALRRQGIEVEVWRLHEWDERYAEPRRVLEEAGVTQVALAPDAAWFRVGRIAAAAADARRIDLLHLHGAFNVWNTLASRAARRPYAFSPHSGYDPVSLRRSRGRKAAYRLAFERRMLREAALLTALTEPERDQLRDQGARGEIVVIPNGVEAAPEDADPGAFRAELGLPPDAHLAAFVGRLDVHRKGLDLLVEGIAEAPGWHLALVGPRFRGVDRLERSIHDRALGERIHIVEPRYGRALHEVLAAADVFVLLSRWEGLPMALLEALSSGTPAVVSPAVERLVPVAASGAGWVAEQDDLPAVLRDAAAEAPLRAAAARDLARRYEWGDVALRYGVAYARALEEVART